MEYIAHIRTDGTVQTIKEHSENTASFSRSFAVTELQDICYVMGLMHDIGKYQPGFQKKITGTPIQIEHSNCGAKEAIAHYGNNPLGLLLALCIIGHHSGIPDCGEKSDTIDNPTLFGRLLREAETFTAYKNDLLLPMIDPNSLNQLLLTHCRTKEELIERYAFLTRYCFSCLTDADSIDTMQAMGSAPVAPLRTDFTRCQALLEDRLASFVCSTPLQKARAELQKQAFQNIRQDADIYLMGMPTGSGKTLASMACALHRVLKTGKKRIIYVIPYNSIIDQTAEVIEKTFGEAAQLLRHQSSFSYEDRDDLEEDYRRSAIYACENWDAELIITTAVQFFESIYANRRGKLRKLHNMADSILIFDEAHLMPLAFLQPCLRGIAFITKYLHSEAIFLTATMPDFGTLIQKYALQDIKIVDLIPDHSDFIHFKKNKYIDLGTISDEQLLQTTARYASSLIVMNSRRAAQRLYDKCNGRKFHLSTYMTSQDRSRVISLIREEIRRLYKDYPDMVDVPSDRRITVISTSLVEAGVDLDFTAAFRELNGLDNVLQTGGRCNREGQLDKGDVYIFERADSHSPQTSQQNILRGILRNYDDISSDEAIRQYYRTLFQTEHETITQNSVIASSLDSIPFRSYSEHFHMIDSGTVSVVAVQDDTCHDLIETARFSGHIPIRKIQRYCFSVYPYELETLLKQHALEEICGVYVLKNMDYYDAEKGILFEGKDIFL